MKWMIIKKQSKTKKEPQNIGIREDFPKRPNL